MTTGEKLLELRKKKGITQDNLAEILNVSRQSVSKWESDIAFPETAKLIELAKLYNVSVDYLLNVDNNVKETVVEEKVVNDKKSNSILDKKSFFNSCFIAGGGLVSLLLYFMTVAKAAIYYGYGYVTVNVYEFAFSSNYMFGNVLFTLMVLSSFALTILGGCNIYYGNKNGCKLAANWLMIAQIAIAILSVVLIFTDATIGLYILTIYFITQFVLFKVLPQNKY